MKFANRSLNSFIENSKLVRNIGLLISLLPSIHQHFYLSIYLSIYLSTYLYIYLPIYLSICLSSFLHLSNHFRSDYIHYNFSSIYLFTTSVSFFSISTSLLLLFSSLHLFLFQYYCSYIPSHFSSNSHTKYPISLFLGTVENLSRLLYFFLKVPVL